MLHDQGTHAGACNNLEGREEVGSGREGREGGDTCMPMVILVEYGRNQHNVVKQLSFN